MRGLIHMRSAIQFGGGRRFSSIDYCIRYRNRRGNLSLARLGQVAELIEGFDTPYGMELLATVHWVAHRGGPKSETPASDFATAAEQVHAWNPRKKKVFRPEHIRTAWNRLSQQGWINTVSSAKAARLKTSYGDAGSGLRRENRVSPVAGAEEVAGPLSKPCRKNLAVGCVGHVAQARFVPDTRLAVFSETGILRKLWGGLAGAPSGSGGLVTRPEPRVHRPPAPVPNSAPQDTMLPHNPCRVLNQGKTKWHWTESLRHIGGWEVFLEWFLNVRSALPRSQHPWSLESATVPA